VVAGFQVSINAGEAVRVPLGDRLPGDDVDVVVPDATSARVA
jgi:hypothetical protein